MCRVILLSVFTEKVSLFSCQVGSQSVFVMLKFNHRVWHGVRRACRKGVAGCDATHGHCQSREHLALNDLGCSGDGRIYNAVIPIGPLSDSLDIIGSFPSLHQPSG